MKKQIITVVAVALAAIILFVAYSLFFKPSDIEVDLDEFYILYADVATALGEVDEKTEIALCGYDSTDDNWVIIYRFAESVAKANKKFDLTTAESGDFKGIRVTSNGNTKEIPFESFFKSLYDGTYYAFDGESLMANAILSLNGKEELSVQIRPLSGYDINGDTITNTGSPFVFPAIDRSKISYLTVTNEHGTYSVLQENNKFYFGSSVAVLYDDEMFSQVTTNMRYNVAYGKMEMPEGKTWADYKLDKIEEATASYSIITTTESNGTYKMHTVVIGEKSSTGLYYFARYLGAVYEVDSTGDYEDNKMLHDLSKDMIYFIPVATVEQSIMLPETAMMKPILVNSINDTQEIFKFDNIRIDYLDKNISAFVKNFSSLNAADNLAALNSSKFADCISDKKSADEYSSYSDGWQKHTDVFGAFTSNNGKSTYIEAALAKKSTSGDYKVAFGLLRDEANGAYLPAKVTVTISYDGNNWHELENGTVNPTQSDKTVQNYEISFHDDKNVRFLRVSFDVPQLAKTYVVFDEIRIFIDGNVDAQPVDTINGVWKLVSPVDYIAEGRNYAHLDMSNFNTFLQSVAALQGEKVVACGFSDNGNATSSLLDKELLGKFGLAEPARHYSFEYDNILCDIYVSAPNEEGKYYAYSTYSGNIDGKDQIITTDVIVEISKETAKWLDWEFVEFLDHALISAYVSEIQDFKISFDGNEYPFLLTSDSAGANLQGVSLNGKDMDTTSFKYIYKSILSIYMQDEYVLQEGETGEEYLRLEYTTATDTTEIVFYRVSSTKCYFTVNGQGSYYALVEQAKTVREKVTEYVAGGIITK